MSGSEVGECPICGKSVRPLAILTQHVEECLATGGRALSEMKKTETRTTSSLQNQKNLPKSSFFSSGKSTFNTELKTTETSPQNHQKRYVSPLAGKSDNSPPGKKPKLEIKRTASEFFQARKEKLKPTVTVPLKSEPKSLDKNPDKMVSMGIPSNKENPVKVVSMGIPSNKGKHQSKGEFTPLAERMRPCGLQEYVGQTKVVGNDSLLRSLLETNEVPSMILWGPPGCGKTSLAHVIASGTKKTSNNRFVTLSATTSGINDVKEVIKVAKNEQQMFKRKTILFMDEIHRFNKSQQDTFLPHVENGTITLIGATTENPSFHLNNALLSRCRVFVLEKLSSEELQEILLRAVKSMGLSVLNDDREEHSDSGDTSMESDSGHPVVIEKDAIVTLSNLCDGDARVALNGLQLAVQAQIAVATKKSQQHHSINVETSHLTNGALSTQHSLIKVDVSHVKEGLQRTHLLYDKKGDEHYNIISALHKSIRGSDANASLYWLARMLAGGEDPLYIARRLVRFASEDVGLADPLALNQAVAAYQACHFIGMPECDVILAQATVYLARARKSIEVYSAYNQAKKCVNEWDGPHPSVPLHIRNAPTKLMKNLGYGAGYKYNPSFDGPVDQTYLPTQLVNRNFFESDPKLGECFQ